MSSVEYVDFVCKQGLAICAVAVLRKAVERALVDKGAASGAGATRGVSVEHRIGCMRRPWTQRGGGIVNLQLPTQLCSFILWGGRVWYTLHAVAGVVDPQQQTLRVALVAVLYLITGKHPKHALILDDAGVHQWAFIEHTIKLPLQGEFDCTVEAQGATLVDRKHNTMWVEWHVV